jgi:hypothetical protein
MDEDTLLAQKFAAILPHLDEKQRRLLLPTEVRTSCVKFIPSQALTIAQL